MIALVAPTLLGFILGIAMGGTLHGWRGVHVKWWFPALAALGLQLFLYNPPIDSQPWALAYGPWLFVLAKAILVAVLLANALAQKSYRGAWAIATLGVALNLVVVAANGGYMPQSEQARIAARGATLFEHETTPRLHNVRPMDDDTRLALLGDVIAQPTWMPRSNVVSFGDLLLAGGLGLWVFQVTLRVRRSPVRIAAVADS
jgi:Family of unknown function (DUF5317)